MYFKCLIILFLTPPKIFLIFCVFENDVLFEVICFHEGRDNRYGR